MSNRGTLAITARGDGNRWYGRISVPADIAAEARIREGSRVSARRQENQIIIEADDNGRLSFPKPRGKSVKRHAFEAATSTLGLKMVRMPQCGIHIDAIEGQIRVHVPDVWLCDEHKPRRRQRKPRERKPSQPMAQKKSYEGEKMWGTAGAIVTEARRSGKQVAPKTLQQVVDMIREKGVEVKVAGPRLFFLYGKSVTSSDLLDEVNKLYNCSDQNRIALIME